MSVCVRMHRGVCTCVSMRVCLCVCVRARIRVCVRERQRAHALAYVSFTEEKPRKHCPLKYFHDEKRLLLFNNNHFAPSNGGTWRARGNIDNSVNTSPTSANF